MTDSGDEREFDSVDKKKEKSRRPGNTAFKQQRLKAWQPILTPKTVLPLFFAIGIIFAPIGGLLLWASEQVQELVIDYTQCLDDGVGSSGSFVDIPSKNIQRNFYKPTVRESQPPQWKFEVDKNAAPKDRNTCTITFQLQADFKPPVLLYYRLTNFYQNHRRYVKSLDDKQLKGEAVSASALKSSDSCNPLVLNPDGKAYYPCGLMANSLFNDSFSEPVTLGGSKNETYPMTNKGIAWSSDKDRYGPTKYNLSDIVPPPNWVDTFGPAYNTSENHRPPNLKEWEEFQVWMRTAGLPTFSKLARRNDKDTMKATVYKIEIKMNFPVKEYGGTKSIVLSTRTVMGGKNPFLGVAYVIVGGLCVLLGTIFTARHLFKPRKLGDHTYLSWENAPATGREGQSAT